MYICSCEPKYFPSQFLCSDHDYNCDYDNSTLRCHEFCWKTSNIAIAGSTAVEQVVACALATQRARVRSPVVISFLGEVFLGVFPHL